MQIGSEFSFENLYDSVVVDEGQAIKFIAKKSW